MAKGIIKWCVAIVVVGVGGYTLFQAVGDYREASTPEGMARIRAREELAAREANPPVVPSTQPFPKTPRELPPNTEQVLGIDPLLPPRTAAPANFRTEYPEVPWFVRFNAFRPPGVPLSPEFAAAAKYTPDPGDVAKLSAAVNALIAKAEKRDPDSYMPGVGKIERVDAVGEIEPWTTFHHARGVLRLPRNVKEIRVMQAFVPVSESENKMSVEAANIEVAELSRRSVPVPRTEDDFRIVITRDAIPAPAIEFVVPAAFDEIGLRDKVSGELLEIYEVKYTSGLTDVSARLPYNNVGQYYFMNPIRRVATNFVSQVWMDLIEEADLDESLANLTFRNALERISALPPAETTRIGLTTTFDDLRKIEDPLERFARTMIVTAWTGHRGEGRLITMGEYFGLKYFLIVEPDDVQGLRKGSTLLVYDAKGALVGDAYLAARQQFDGKDMLPILAMHLSGAPDRKK